MIRLRCARVAGPCDEGANGGAVVSSVRRGVLDVRIEAASGVSIPARTGGRVVCPIDRIGSAAIRILPDLLKRGEQPMQLTNPPAGSWRRPYREEANFDHAESKFTGEERGTTAV